MEIKEHSFETDIVTINYAEGPPTDSPLDSPICNMVPLAATR